MRRERGRDSWAILQLLGCCQLDPPFLHLIKGQLLHQAQDSWVVKDFGSSRPRSNVNCTSSHELIVFVSHAQTHVSALSYEYVIRSGFWSCLVPKFQKQINLGLIGPDELFLLGELYPRQTRNLK